MNRTQAGIGALLGFLGVALGAFATHGLRGQLSVASLEIFQTGAHYQLIHAVAIVVFAAIQAHDSSPRLTLAINLLIAGTVVFSGSLYALALSGVRILGAVAPLGGACLLAGWALLAWTLLRSASGADR